MTQELHIAGVVVYARAHLDDACEAISRMAGARVHGASPEGKLVVTLEAHTTAAILDRMDEMRGLRGVVDVALVYQHAEPEQDMAETMQQTIEAEGQA